MLCLMIGRDVAWILGGEGEVVISISWCLALVLFQSLRMLIITSCGESCWRSRLGSCHQRVDIATVVVPMVTILES